MGIYFGFPALYEEHSRAAEEFADYYNIDIDHAMDWEHDYSIIDALNVSPHLAANVLYIHPDRTKFLKKVQEFLVIWAVYVAAREGDFSQYTKTKVLTDFLSGDSTREEVEALDGLTKSTQLAQDAVLTTPEDIDGGVLEILELQMGDPIYSLMFSHLIHSLDEEN